MENIRDEFTIRNRSEDNECSNNERKVSELPIDELLNLDIQIREEIRNRTTENQELPLYDEQDNELPKFDEDHLGAFYDGFCDKHGIPIRLSLGCPACYLQLYDN